MKKACRYCGRIHDTGYICPKKPLKNKRTTAFDKFRSSSVWQNKREMIKKRDNYCCKICFLSIFDTKIDDFYTEVHHIIPLAEDYSKRLDDDNLITLCERHHKLAENGVISRAELFSLTRPTTGKNHQ